ncbi:MAG: hypothetical protein H6707_15945 [Deltaproteobacteria bacterium]|nr:hypothetical protein [Deltaproteobacteria bacterium]
MAFLLLIAIGFAGGIVWIFNVETAAAAYGATSGWHPIVVGLGCALGQASAYTALFFSGEFIGQRWGWARKQIVRTREKYGERLETGFLWFTAPAALIGLPPMTGMAAVAGGFHVRLLPMLAIAFSLRWVRFTIIAWAGPQLLLWVKSLLSWLRSHSYAALAPIPLFVAIIVYTYYRRRLRRKLHERAQEHAQGPAVAETPATEDQAP